MTLKMSTTSSTAKISAWLKPPAARNEVAPIPRESNTLAERPLMAHALAPRLRCTFGKKNRLNTISPIPDMLSGKLRSLDENPNPASAALC